MKIKNKELSFELISNKWRMQNKNIHGQNCLFSLLQVRDASPATITVYKFKEDANNLNQIKDSVEKNTESQGWEIISSNIIDIGTFETLELIAISNIDEQPLELHVMVILNKGNMYVFELLSFSNNNFALPELRNIFGTLKFN